MCYGIDAACAGVVLVAAALVLLLLSGVSGTDAGVGGAGGDGVCKIHPDVEIGLRGECFNMKRPAWLQFKVKQIYPFHLMSDDQ